MATCSLRRFFGGATGGSLPASVAKRFRRRIAIGSSSVPRRQADSHGAVQIQPHTDGNGLTSAATAYASSKRPCATSPTYRPASVPAWQPLGDVTRESLKPERVSPWGKLFQWRTSERLPGRSRIDGPRDGSLPRSQG